MPTCNYCGSPDVYWIEKLIEVNGTKKFIWVFGCSVSRDKGQPYQEHTCKWKHIKGLPEHKRPFCWYKMKKISDTSKKKADRTEYQFINTLR